jgi:hypothetical protein
MRQIGAVKPSPALVVGRFASTVAAPTREHETVITAIRVGGIG